MTITPILFRSKIPEQLRRNENFFKRNQFLEKLFSVDTKNAVLTRLPRKLWRNFEKTIGSNTEKVERKEEWTSSKIKKIYTSHFSPGKDQSSIDNLLEKFGQNSVLSSLKNAKTIKIFFVEDPSTEEKILWLNWMQLC